MIDLNKFANTLNLLNKLVTIGGTVGVEAVQALGDFAAESGKTRDELMAMSDADDAETEALIADLRVRLAGTDLKI